MVFEWKKDRKADPDAQVQVFHVDVDGKDFAVHFTFEALENTGNGKSDAEGIEKCKRIAESKITRGDVTTAPYRRVIVTGEDAFK